MNIWKLILLKYITTTSYITITFDPGQFAIFYFALVYIIMM